MALKRFKRFRVIAMAIAVIRLIQTADRRTGFRPTGTATAFPQGTSGSSI